MLEDFETIDTRVVEDFSRSRSSEDKNTDKSGNLDHNVKKQNKTKYYLVLRQSSQKYELFRRPQVTEM